MDIQKAIQERFNAEVDQINKTFLPDMVKGKKAEIGEVREYSGVKYIKMTATGNANKDWVRFNPATHKATKESEVQKQNKEVESKPEASEDEINDLEVGFSDHEFENFVTKNKKDIKDNMLRYGFKKSDLGKVTNYYDFANILGVDTNAVKDIDHNYFGLVLKDLLYQE